MNLEIRARCGNAVVNPDAWVDYPVGRRFWFCAKHLQMILEGRAQIRLSDRDETLYIQTYELPTRVPRAGLMRFAR